MREGWRTTLHCARLLDATAVLFQCPASFKPTAENAKSLRRFMKRIGKFDGRRLWEPRGPWPASLVAELCEELDLVHVVDPFVTNTVTRGLTYFRLHGITGARHVYSTDELRRLVDMIPARGRTYVMFNNMPRLDDALRFRELLGE